MCDTLVVVDDAGVRFAKNSDRDPNEAQHLDWRPAARHDPGATVACTHLTIPQVDRTHAVLLSRPFWMWGAEMGTNEHGVTIGNEAVFTDQPYAEVGLTGMDLLRLALERAATAEEAVGVLVDLLETHGQGGGCGHEDRSFTYHNSFLVADADGAYVLETAGRRWATEEVDYGVRSISNGLTIPAFAAAHAGRLRGRVAACATRAAATAAGATRRSDPAGLAAVLRTHAGPDGPRYTWHNGGLTAPCVHAGGRLASSQTTASWIADLGPGGPRHWATATAAPCTSLFKPVAVDQPLDLGPLPTDHVDEAALWWRHELLHRRVVRDPARWLPALAEDRAPLEDAWFTDPPASTEAFAAADEWTHRWRQRTADAGPGRDRRPGHVRRYWRVRDRRAALHAWSTGPEERSTARGRARP